MSQERRKVDRTNPGCGLKGIPCPRCGSRDSHVYKTDNGVEQISRIRECLECKFRWPTVEKISNLLPVTD